MEPRIWPRAVKSQSLHELMRAIERCPMATFEQQCKATYLGQVFDPARPDIDPADEMWAKAN